MFAHEFIFTPGIWIGEGRIVFSATHGHLRYYTKWQIEEKNNDRIHCQQEVQMQKSSDVTVNQYVISDLKPSSFVIELSNEIIGFSTGKGVIDSKTIAWEFRGKEAFEGFEVYELQDNGDYMIHAEYASPDNIRTIIDGRIWKKNNS